MIPSDHPVAAALAARRDRTARTSDVRLALVVEGGGMRGVVAGGMVAALEQLGLTDAFDEVIGSSAGAIAGAYFVAGQAAFGTRIFYEEINNRRFIFRPRLLAGRPAVSVDFLLDEVCRHAKPLDWQAVLHARTRLVCMATNIDRAVSVALEGFANDGELFRAMRASARIPAVAGPPVIIDGERHVDASVTASIPLAAALARGATHIVVLMTRPSGCVPVTLDLAERFLFVPWLERHAPGLGQTYRTSPARYAVEVGAVARAARSRAAPFVLSVAVPADTVEVGNAETSVGTLQAAAFEGYKAVFHAFGESPAAIPGELHLTMLTGSGAGMHPSSISRRAAPASSIHGKKV